jgi:Luciferase-like monooxygenase
VISFAQPLSLTQLSVPDKEAVFGLRALFEGSRDVGAPMKWGIFLLSQFPDQERRVVSFQEELEQCVLAEQLGFTSVWIAEHLFSSYCAVSSAQVFAAAVSVLTKRIRIGTAVVVMPFNHPLRTAADFALVDALSNGRLCLGVGRGYNPAEFAGLGLPIDKSRAMFSEGMDQLVQPGSAGRRLLEGLCQHDFVA